MGRSEKRKQEQQSKRDFKAMNKEQKLIDMFQKQMSETWSIMEDALITAMRGHKISESRVNDILNDMYKSVKARTNGQNVFGIAQIKSDKHPYMLTKDQFDNLVSGIMTVNCKNCTKDVCERGCDFRYLFSTLNIPKPTGYEPKNGCDYFYE